jgi:hypothetical protein
MAARPPSMNPARPRSNLTGPLPGRSPAEPRPRRVPGLRREEVAQLANVGLTWYTWEDHTGAPASAGLGLDTLVQDFEPARVYAISARFDVLAHNRAARLMFGKPRPAGHFG